MAAPLRPKRSTATSTRRASGPLSSGLGCKARNLGVAIFLLYGTLTMALAPHPQSGQGSPLSVARSTGPGPMRSLSEELATGGSSPVYA